MSDININLEEGFLTQQTEKADNYDAIIIVPPCAGSNIITMYNIEHFMNEGVYIPSDDIKKVTPTSITHSLEITCQATRGSYYSYH